MIGGKRQSFYTRYLREVIWGKCLRPPKLSPKTYIQINPKGNRYFYLALRFLSSKSRPCAALARKPYIVGPFTYCTHMDDYARLAYSYPCVRFCTRMPHETGDKVLIHDGSDPRVVERKWGKVVRIDYDIASTAPRDAAWMVMPYPMHPLIYATGGDGEIHRLRRGERKMRIFFAGNADPEVYRSSRSMQAIRGRLGMMDRVRVIGTLVEGLGDGVRQIKRTEELHEIVAAGFTRTCVLATDRSVRIELDKWLKTLSLCDVFLAPPGVFMPLCHNAIEAMAVGCIPLINYPAWFTPRLEHMKNCIHFTDQGDLIEKADMVLEMGPATLAQMRANVCDYYDRFLDPDRFLDRLLNHAARELTLFMVTENQGILERVAENSVILADLGEFEDGGASEEHRPSLSAGSLTR